jgi:hypothetical protein
VKGGKAGSHTHTGLSRRRPAAAGEGGKGAAGSVLASIQDTVCHEPNQIMCRGAAPLEVARPRDALAPTC